MFNNFFLSLNYVLYYLLLLFPIFYIIGPFTADLAVSLSAIIALTLIIQKKLIFKSIILNIFMIWCIYLIINSFFSINPLLSLEQSLFNIRFGLFSFGFILIMNENHSFIKGFLNLSIIVFLLVLIDSIIQFFYGSNLLGYTMNEDDGIRISGIFKDIHLLGFYISIFCPVIISLILVDKNILNNIYFLYFLICLSLIAIFISTERMSLILFVSYLFILSFFVRKIRHLKYLIILFPFLFLIFIQNSDSHKYRFFEQPLKQLDQYGNFYETSKNIFFDNLLFGVGPKNYRIECSNDKYASYIVINGKKRNACSTHPHNIYFQLFSETGIIGTLPVILFFLSIIYKFYNINFVKKNHYINNENANSILIVSFLILFPFFISASFFYNYSSILKYFCFSFLLAFNFRKNNFIL